MLGMMLFLFASGSCTYVFHIQLPAIRVELQSIHNRVHADVARIRYEALQ